ncbi:MAG: CAP domain-containing protein [Patescibacteria group bacterium]
MNISRHLRDFFVPDARNNYTPHAVSHRNLSFYAGLMFSVKLLTLFSLDLLPQNQAFSSALTQENVLQLTNYSRQAFGLSELKINTELSKAALAKAEDMFKGQYFAHNSPLGLTPWDFIKAEGYNYIIAGENLAVNFYTSESLESAWMNSPEHKSNILNKDFQDIGIGIFSGTLKGLKATVVVQMFGSVMDQPIVMKNSFTAKQTLSSPEQKVFIPTPQKISLTTPFLESPDFNLTNKKVFSLKGFAPGADTVYVLINHEAVASAPVAQGKFSADLNLLEGSSIVNVVSFKNGIESSPISKTLTIQLDTSAPNVSEANVRPSAQGEYIVEVQTQGDVTKVLANLGDKNIFLQPTQDPNVWQGRFVGSIEDLQGKLSVSAYDLAGNAKISSVANLAVDTVDTYGFMAEKDYKVSLVGQIFSLKTVNQFYIYFVLFLLVALGVSIGIKRHVQNLGLIAHTSAMVVVALIFWVT